MRVLVTGAKGQLGYDVVRELEKRNHVVIGVDKDDMDITDEGATNKMITDSQVDAVIHCAAYTAVDTAEDQIDLCSKINVDGTRNIAQICKKLDVPMMYISTDYVFDGEGTTPWKTEDERNPLNVYGKMKYEGELVIEDLLEKYFIVRISWVFGKNGKNFVKSMISLGKKMDELTVVSDQFGSPTYTYDLAVLLADMIQSHRYGIYHATNEGICSWYEFAEEIFRQAGLNVRVKPVDSSEYPTKAKRPKNSRMSKSKLVENGFNKLPDWQDALSRYLKEIDEL